MSNDKTMIEWKPNKIPQKFTHQYIRCIFFVSLFQLPPAPISITWELYSSIVSKWTCNLKFVTTFVF